MTWLIGLPTPQGGGGARPIDALRGFSAALVGIATADGHRQSG
jgi:hypothetical protein